MRGENYSWGFLLSIVAFVEGALFVLFTWELLQEQIESIEDNQTYVDDMQKLWGKQRTFWQNAEQFFGKDYWWWLMPTHPSIKINYLERLYTKNQLKQIIRSGVESEEEEWDLNKKNYLHELKRSNFEKKVFVVTLVLFLLFWQFYY